MNLLACPGFVSDFGGRKDGRGVVDVVGGAVLRGDFAQVSGVRGIESSDDEHEIETLTHEVHHGVLSVLGGRADGVEGAEMGFDVGFAVAVGEGAAQAVGDFQRFARQHGGLVGDADAFEVAGGIEAGRGGLADESVEGLGGGVASDHGAHAVGLVEVAHDEIVSAVGQGAAFGRDGLLVGRISRG
jgi:hypothetical protein